MTEKCLEKFVDCSLGLLETWYVRTRKNRSFCLNFKMFVSGKFLWTSHLSQKVLQPQYSNHYSTSIQSTATWCNDHYTAFILCSPSDKCKMLNLELYYRWYNFKNYRWPHFCFIDYFSKKMKIWNSVCVHQNLCIVMVFAWTKSWQVRSGYSLCYTFLRFSFTINNFYNKYKSLSRQ